MRVDVRVFAGTTVCVRDTQTRSWGVVVAEAVRMKWRDFTTSDKGFCVSETRTPEHSALPGEGREEGECRPAGPACVGLHCVSMTNST